jgi:uncharacterized protein YndB with AHSA1/START domain
MAHAEASITINRPVQEVFEYILDGANNARWRPGVTDVKRASESPLGAGAVFKQGLKGPGGRRMDGDYKITQCQPGELIEFQVIAGPARPTGSYKFAPAGGATTITFVLDFQPKGLAKLMDGMITNTMQAEVATLSNLKSVLETRA